MNFWLVWYSYCIWITLNMPAVKSCRIRVFSKVKLQLLGPTFWGENPNGLGRNHQIFVVGTFLWIRCLWIINIYQYTDFGTLNPRRFALDTKSASENVHTLLMEEIRHHLGCVKPCREWTGLNYTYQLVSRISEPSTSSMGMLLEVYLRISYISQPSVHQGQFQSWERTCRALFRRGTYIQKRRVMWNPYHLCILHI